MQRVRGEAFFMAVLVAAGLVLPADAATKRSALDRLKEKGWTLEPLSTPGAYCARAVPPANAAGARPLASCLIESKGLAFGLYVFKSTVTADQVKSLGDKVVARLP